MNADGDVQRRGILQLMDHIVGLINDLSFLVGLGRVQKNFLFARGITVNCFRNDALEGYDISPEVLVLMDGKEELRGARSSEKPAWDHH